MLAGSYYGQTIQIWSALVAASVLAAGLGRPGRAGRTLGAPADGVAAVSVQIDTRAPDRGALSRPDPWCAATVVLGVLALAFPLALATAKRPPSAGSTGRAR